MYGASKTMGIKYSNVETLLLIASPPIKISGYAPAQWRNVLEVAESYCETFKLSICLFHCCIMVETKDVQLQGKTELI